MEYNLDYYELMLRRNAKTAEEICASRWGWIQDIKHDVVLDYGSGCGFFRAYRPSNTEVYSYDTASYPQTGIPLKLFDVTCLWDVLEHISDFDKLAPVLALSRYVAISLPIKPEDVLWNNWKHFKPDEHLHYWSKSTLISFLKQYGFRLLKDAMPECPPREDIISFLFGRIK